MIFSSFKRDILKRDSEILALKRDSEILAGLAGLYFVRRSPR
jgi:hypothetical protein